MVRLERSRGNFVRPPIAALCLVQASCLLANNAQIVQAVREVRVIGTELGFLSVDSPPKQLLGGPDIAAGCGLFGGVENGLHADGVGHVRRVAIAMLRHRTPTTFGATSSDLERQISNVACS
jgi:hypothetical protein